ncbi:hypothetical protein M3Y97_01005100 [Aphelenchoides bicaudatus]|nr:hypothetical protein M3Y97_01005100 [Aphelenchoides bicaudatus]
MSVNQTSSELSEQVAQLPDKLLVFSTICRGFLTVCFSVVVIVSPTMFTTILRVKEIDWHMRICYAANILNSFCYMFTFAMNQPFLLMPSSFALFRGALRNRFGVVSLAISFANLISGVIVTILFRLLSEVHFNKLQRMLIGTIPYALFHLTAILPSLVYIIQTMNYLDEEHLSRENLNIFIGREWLFRSGSVYYFPRTQLSTIYSIIQIGSFVIGIILALLIVGKEFRRHDKFCLNTALHTLALAIFHFSTLDFGFCNYLHETYLRNGSQHSRAHYNVLLSASGNCLYCPVCWRSEEVVETAIRLIWMFLIKPKLSLLNK